MKISVKVEEIIRSDSQFESDYREFTNIDICNDSENNEQIEIDIKGEKIFVNKAEIVGIITLLS